AKLAFLDAGAPRTPLLLRGRDLHAARREGSEAGRERRGGGVGDRGAARAARRRSALRRPRPDRDDEELASFSALVGDTRRAPLLPRGGARVRARRRPRRAGPPEVRVDDSPRARAAQD